jgi:hypothetical protein
MPYNCKGNCKKYKPKKFPWRYFGNNKRCSVCATFIDWEGMICPCCNAALKLKPRSKVKKAKQDTTSIMHLVKKA